MSCKVIDINGARAIVCSKGGRPKPCQAKASPTCTSAEYLCDGCDVSLCRSCAVSTGGHDWCPRCFEPVWRKWLKQRTTFILAAPDVQREERRRLFREWAHAHPDEFLCLPRSRAAEGAAR